jgi:hypothetical protein
VVHHFQAAKHGLHDGCVLNHDLILFPINISNVHWILSLVDTKRHQIILLDSMDTRKVIMLTVRALSITFAACFLDYYSSCRSDPAAYRLMSQLAVGCRICLHQPKLAH